MSQNVATNSLLKSATTKLSPLLRGRKYAFSVVVNVVGPFSQSQLVYRSYLGVYLMIVCTFLMYNLISTLAFVLHLNSLSSHIHYLWRSTAEVHLQIVKKSIAIFIQGVYTLGANTTRILFLVRRGISSS